jgi:hypothetical protein
MAVPVFPTAERRTYPVTPMTHRALSLALSLSVMATLTGQAPTGVRLVPAPAAAGSGMYALAAAAGEATPRVVLSWLEPTTPGGHALRYAEWNGDGWSVAREAARGPRWFANWADHPTVVPAPGGALLAHWLVRAGDGRSKYGYGIRVARASASDLPWTLLFSAEPSADDYAGFLAFLPEPDGFGAAYLAPASAPAATAPAAGAHDAGHPEPVKTLVWTRVAADGRSRGSDVIDADVCSCCTVAAAVTGRGPIIAYRDRTAGDVRDIAVVRQLGGTWTPPRIVHDDGWRIPGCPTNGPAIAADGLHVVVAWFTAAEGVARVRVAWSSDAGATFGPPVVVDGGSPIGWTGVVVLPDGDAVVSWLESSAGGGGQVRGRRVSRDGRLGTPVVVAETRGGRATGIPQLARAGDRLIVAWRDDAVKTAVVSAAALPPARGAF